MDRLKTLRAPLDQADRELLERLKQRLDLVAEVAALRADCPVLKLLGSYPARTTARGRVDRFESDAP
jgi:hypothetical protein